MGFAALVTLLCPAAPRAGITAFTFQGELSQGGQPVEGACDLQLKLFDAASGGAQVGTTQASDAVPFTNGLFFVPVDFGANAFPGADRWLEIAARCPAGAGAFTTFPTRQQIRSVPYAIRAMTANVLDAPGGGPANALNVDQTGRIGVGTLAPGATMDIRGTLVLDSGGDAGLFTSSSNGEQNRYLTLLNSPTSPSASGLKAGGILVADSFSFYNPGKNDLVVKGRVAIGNGLDGSTSRLRIDGQDAISIEGYQPFISLTDTNENVDRPGMYRLQTSEERFDVLRRPGCSGLGCSADFTSVLHIENNNVGIGSIAPRHRLGLGGGPKWTTNGWAGSVELDNGAALGWKANGAGKRFGMGHSNGGFYFFHTTADPGTSGAPADYDLQILDSGTVSVKVLEITGGADLAEPFDIAPSHGSPTIAAGMVMVIDAEHPGQLRVSTRAYDRTAAGVVSGANGLAPGMVMKSQGDAHADGAYPVALTGRVWTLCDATSSTIVPGDLLTTSSTAGHAMKATDHPRAQGATIGKAMTSLARGAKGLVLTLVSLQ